MEIKLVLEFKNAAGDKTSMSFDDPKETLDDAEVISQMNNIIAADVFTVKGSSFATAAGAYRLQTEKIEYEIGE